MRLIFMDESGYAGKNWSDPDSLEKQPYYVVSAVSIPSDEYKKGVKKLIEEIAKLDLPGSDRLLKLGLEFEIKARDIATGRGYWRNHNKERDIIRNLMLSFPHNNNGCAFVTIIDKKAHFNKYAFPEDPYSLALQFTLERIQHHLRDENEEGIIIYDLNHVLEPDLSSIASFLIKEGSYIFFYDELLVIPLDRVLEFTFARSKNSVGLIVADFFATMTYHYHKYHKHVKQLSWWDTLLSSLYRSKDGIVEGYGYKVFP